MLLVLSILMGTAYVSNSSFTPSLTIESSFLAGSLPLSFSLSHSQLHLISTVGMGVLVGTSLIVIIPEGVETLYSAHAAEDLHTEASFNQPSRAGHDIGAEKGKSLLARALGSSSWISFPRNEAIDAINSAPGPVLPGSLPASTSSNREPPKTPTEPGVVGIMDTSAAPAPSHAEQKSVHTPHAWVGISLILGFILMYLIDTLPALKPSSPPQRMSIYSLSDLGSASPSGPMGSSTSRNSMSTTLGLVIHAAADGIALGASSTRPSLSLVIFLAIMVHKAPAAFGLTSVLLKQGLGKRAARAHLVLFSLAAPLGALATWAIVSILGGGGTGPGSEEVMRWWTGVLLLFSGGTFL